MNSRQASSLKNTNASSPATASEFLLELRQTQTHDAQRRVLGQLAANKGDYAEEDKGIETALPVPSSVIRFHERPFSLRG